MAARKPSKLDALPRVEMTERSGLRAWLDAHHEASEGIWLVTFKKGASHPRLPYDDIVEELLCFGWVDSLPRALDDERTMLLCTPRKPTSKWSALNKRRVERMTAAGRMSARGQAVVERARRDGTWTALDAVEALEVPPDLAAAFEAHPGARAHWDAFPPSVRRGILEWIVSAKRPATRDKRVATTAEQAARNERANQWRK